MDLDPELLFWILEFALRQHIRLETINRLLAMVPSELERPARVDRALVQRLLLEGLKRRLINTVTLDNIEALHALRPLPSAVDAYCIVAIHLAASATDLPCAVADLWGRRVANLLRSPSTAELASQRLISEGTDLCLAITQPALRTRILGRFTKNQALDAVRALLEADYEDVGQPLLELVAETIDKDEAENVPSGSRAEATIPPVVAQQQATLRDAQLQATPVVAQQQATPRVSQREMAQITPGAAQQLATPVVAQQQATPRFAQREKQVTPRLAQREKQATPRLAQRQMAQITPRAAQQQATPVVAQQQATPVVAQQQATPVVAQQQATPVVAQQQETPVVAQQQETPVVAQQQATPRVARQQMAQITPSATQQQATPVVAQQQETPVVAQQQATPVVAQQQATPVVAQQQATPVVAQQQATPRVARQQMVQITPSATQQQATPVVAQQQTAHAQIPPIVSQQQATDIPPRVAQQQTKDIPPRVEQQQSTQMPSGAKATQMPPQGEEAHMLPRGKEMPRQSEIDGGRHGKGTTPTMNEGGNSNKAMEQRPATRTYERDGRLKGKAVCPPTLVENKRRKTRRWSVLEEDTLRSAVLERGKGYWKEILRSHSDVFEGRTEVDLKDKWRNMTR